MKPSKSQKYLRNPNEFDLHQIPLRPNPEMHQDLSDSKSQTHDSQISCLENLECILNEEEGRDPSNKSVKSSEDYEEIQIEEYFQGQKETEIRGSNAGNESQEEDEPSEDKEDARYKEELENYVRCFQQEIEVKFKRSEENRCYRFPRHETGDSESEENSLESIKDVLKYDLASQNYNIYKKEIKQGIMEAEKAKNQRKSQMKKERNHEGKRGQSKSKEKKRGKGEKGKLTCSELERGIEADLRPISKEEEMVKDELSVLAALRILEKVEITHHDSVKSKLSDKNSPLYKALYRIVEENMRNDEKETKNEGLGIDKMKPGSNRKIQASPRVEKFREKAKKVPVLQVGHENFKKNWTYERANQSVKRERKTKESLGAKSAEKKGAKSRPSSSISHGKNTIQSTSRGKRGNGSPEESKNLVNKFLNGFKQTSNLKKGTGLTCETFKTELSEKLKRGFPRKISYKKPKDPGSRTSNSQKNEHHIEKEKDSALRQSSQGNRKNPVPLDPAETAHRTTKPNGQLSEERSSHLKAELIEKVPNHFLAGKEVRGLRPKFSPNYENSSNDSKSPNHMNILLKTIQGKLNDKRIIASDKREKLISSTSQNNKYMHPTPLMSSYQKTHHQESSNSETMQYFVQNRSSLTKNPNMSHSSSKSNFKGVSPIHNQFPLSSIISSPSTSLDRNNKALPKKSYSKLTSALLSKLNKTTKDPGIHKEPEKKKGFEAPNRQGSQKNSKNTMSNKTTGTPSTMNPSFQGNRVPYQAKGKCGVNTTLGFSKNKYAVNMAERKPEKWLGVEKLIGEKAKLQKLQIQEQIQTRVFSSPKDSGPSKISSSQYASCHVKDTISIKIHKNGPLLVPKPF